MYISAAGAQVQSERLRVLANNLANVDTAGFKREEAIFQARFAEAIERGEDQPGSRSINDSGGGVRFAETITDFSKGNLRQTGEDTDLAIDGDGFFLVEKDGEQQLTRAGNFRLSAEGRLETQQGHAVLAADGKPLTIDPRLPWRVSESGAVEQADRRTYLALVKPRSLGDLAKAGVNYFTPLAPVAPVAVAERRVRSGYLEASTVVPSVEMMELIETSRAFEANVRMIQNHDQMMGALVNRVLRTA
jgi:flagellar basal-body rod protein FlgF/flagellar basal-body rod protein FlgG